MAELLANHTTLRVGGPVADFVVATTEAELVSAVRDADDRGQPLLVLGGGSNVLVSDSGFDGRVVAVRSAGVQSDADACGGAVARVAAGEVWDGFVTRAVGQGWIGVEALSGIPGLVGATPIQNVGAYGQEVAETICSVRAVERGAWRTRELSPRDCGFGYRDSTFKREPGRFVVLGVTFGLRPGAAPALRYRELGEALAGHPAPTLADARAAVLALRARKSMLVTAGDPNRRSVGSFFMNPILDAEEADRVAARAGEDGARMPRWPAGDRRVKLSAGWLIERSGIAKGLRRGPVGVSTAHALALVHHGGGTTAALLALAREIQETVRTRFAVTLVPEPIFLGLSWNPASG